MKRAKKMQEALDDFTKDVFGRSNTEALAENVCVTCGKKIDGFKDALSKKEYGISGMCQGCQDSVFG